MAGVESIWFMGDDFVERSFETYFKRMDTSIGKPYTNINYEVSGYNNNKFTSINPSMLSRISNTIIKGLQEKIHMPKMIVVVLDDDLVKFVNYYNYRFSDAIGRLLNYLMIEFECTIAAHIDNLPKKAI